MLSHIWMGSGACTSHVDPDISQPFPPAPFLPHFPDVILPLAEIQMPLLSGPPLPLPPSGINTEAKLLEFITPCPRYPHLRQESDLGASERAGKILGLLT